MVEDDPIGDLSALLALARGASDDAVVWSALERELTRWRDPCDGSPTHSHEYLEDRLDRVVNEVALPLHALAHDETSNTRGARHRCLQLARRAWNRIVSLIARAELVALDRGHACGDECVRAVSPPPRVR